MDHALAMGMVDGIADLAGEVEGAVQIERALERDDVLERLTLDVLHHDEEDVVLLLGGGDGDDVRVADACEQTRFTQQLPEVEALAVRNLDGDLLVDPGVVREVDGTKAAAPERC